MKNSFHAVGKEEGVTTKGVFSLEESLESPKSRISLERLENGRILLCFPESEDFFRISKFSREWIFLKRPFLGTSKWGLANGGLARKAPIKGSFGAISALPP